MNKNSKLIRKADIDRTMRKIAGVNKQGGQQMKVMYDHSVPNDFAIVNGVLMVDRGWLHNRLLEDIIAEL